jgi:hypothetical protein
MKTTGRARLILLSFLMLFVELALIRWMGANILYLSYFSNFVLLGSFLGIGLGFLRGTRSPGWFAWAPVALAGLVCLVLYFPVEIDRSSTDLIFFGGDPSGPPIWLVLPIVFLAVAGVMMLIASGVAQVFSTFEPLHAYRYDIIGSIAGIATFTVLSFVGAPPLAWGAVVVVVFLLTVEVRGGMFSRAMPFVALAFLLVLLGIQSFRPGLSWSPYYQVSTDSESGGAVAINVNGIPHQVATDIKDRDTTLPLYDDPYQVGNPSPKNVLVIGAGSGNDVAEALSHGVQHVDAVEIDPRIHEIGVELHPDHPYADPRVTTYLDDGRAFIERTNNTYDLIVLALPDSLTLVAGQSSLRLESYLFTQEAFESYKQHLNPNGSFAMYNVYRETWLRDRYANTLQDVFGSSPCISTVDGAGTIAALTVGVQPGLLHCGQTWQPASAAVPAPATDDHPFPYLQDASIPSFYLWTMFLIVVASLVLVRLVSADGFRPMVRYLDLFAMGAAFMLLETKSIVQFSLLFGTTWLVNALVFGGVLVSVYLAVEVAIHWKTQPNPIVFYGLLLASLVAAWLVPLSSLLSLDFGVRFLVAVGLTFAPIFFANLVFAQRFRDVSSSTSAFGANLLGAMAGGLIEYTALLFGYRNLLVVVALLYGAAFLIGKRTWMRRGTAPAATAGAEPRGPVGAGTPAS